AYARRRYQIYPAKAEESRRKVVAALDRIVAERQPSGYLVGDSFSIADLTAVSLLFPLLWMRPGIEFQYDYPEPPVTETFEAASDHPGLDWMEDIYRRHRGD